jgi:two-component system nitrogen regulation sensor histidine kinase NtrY
VSWQTVTADSTANQLLPARLTSVLLVGSLVPAMALIVLGGRRLALRARRAAGWGRAGGCMCGWSGCSR